MLPTAIRSSICKLPTRPTGLTSTSEWQTPRVQITTVTTLVAERTKSTGASTISRTATKYPVAISSTRSIAILEVIFGLSPFIDKATIGQRTHALIPTAMTVQAVRLGATRSRFETRFAISIGRCTVRTKPTKCSLAIVCPLLAGYTFTALCPTTTTGSTS